MLKCSTCIHKRNIQGDAHVSCSKGAAIVTGVNENAVRNGYFMWPINFDPIWGENCMGFVDISEDLDALSDEEVEKTFKKEFTWLSVMLKNKFQYVHPLNVEKIKKNFFLFQDLVKEFSSCFDTWSREDKIRAVKSIRNI